MDEWNVLRYQRDNWKSKMEEQTIQKPTIIYHTLHRKLLFVIKQYNMLKLED
jgi:hypothetical protein